MFWVGKLLFSQHLTRVKKSWVAGLGGKVALRISGWNPNPEIFFISFHLPSDWGKVARRTLFEGWGSITINPKGRLGLVPKNGCWTSWSKGKGVFSWALRARKKRSKSYMSNFKYILPIDKKSLKSPCKKGQNWHNRRRTTLWLWKCGKWNYNEWCSCNYSEESKKKEEIVDSHRFVGFRVLAAVFVMVLGVDICTFLCLFLFCVWILRCLVQ